jgi:Zn finger protein HypA/HybF involved in hydrogenase expression
MKEIPTKKEIIMENIRIQDDLYNYVNQAKLEELVIPDGVHMGLAIGKFEPGSTQYIKALVLQINAGFDGSFQNIVVPVGNDSVLGDCLDHLFCVFGSITAAEVGLLRSGNLAAAANGELDEHDKAYPAFAEMARREGCDEAARLWLQIARIEGVHHNAFQSLLEQLRSGTLTKKKKPIVWRCLNCGYTYESPNACDPCPVCSKPADWQEGELDRKKMIDKKH